MEFARFRGELNASAGGCPDAEEQAPYPPKFRRQAVALVRAGRELGVSGESVRNWVRRAARDDGMHEDGLTTREREGQLRTNRCRRM